MLTDDSPTTTKDDTNNCNGLQQINWLRLNANKINWIFISKNKGNKTDQDRQQKSEIVQIFGTLIKLKCGLITSRVEQARMSFQKIHIMLTNKSVNISLGMCGLIVECLKYHRWREYLMNQFMKSE